MLMTGTNPKRLRLSRERGFSIETLSRNTNDRDVVNVTRPGFWGNWICVGSPGRLWIKNGAPRNLQTTLTAELPEAVDQARAAAVHRYWLDTDTSSAMDTSRGRAWMIPGFEKLDQDFQTLAEHELLLKRKNTLAQLSRLAGKNLACTCELGTPCHGDTLLELANSSGDCPWPTIMQGSEYDV
jgi:Domain of unknown function (DUF4326)